MATFITLVCFSILNKIFVLRENKKSDFWCLAKQKSYKKVSFLSKTVYYSQLKLEIKNQNENTIENIQKFMEKLQIPIHSLDCFQFKQRSKET